MCTTMMAFVFDVIFFSISSGSIFRCSGLTMSQNTGVAPTYLIQFTDAANVNEGQSTSSPGLMSVKIQERCKASVQFDILTA